ncbi:hypothetical protein [Paraburkholderia sp. BL10I2N1]|uniref:hypothetical protein n=1 Tax=Paraburkholderia sp. BL10I2N1 TaxID=1938796 RepID=UPI001FB727A6|nr:hypothetical protein [Paraburkholderia sp. BL10I2N1]
MSNDATVTQALMSRRSIRARLPDPVDEATLQQIFNRNHRIIGEHLRLPEDEMVVCGMSLGYADLSQPENAPVSQREDVDDFVQFVR